MDFPSSPAILETLANGLTLILDPDPATPVVSTQVWVETGSIHEGAHLGAGLSHFLEHMVFKGGGDFGPVELATSVQAAGGHWNAYTSFDRTVYYIDGPDTGIERFLEVLGAMVFGPHLPESEFEKEKDVIRREIDMGLDDPDDTASRLLFSTLFSHDPRRHPVIGYRDSFDAITHADLVRYHRDRYRPDNACLCISGDFDMDALRVVIDRVFGSLPRTSGAPPLIPLEPTQLAPRKNRATFAVPASKVTLAWKIPALGHPDVVALDLAAAMLGRGRSARLYRKLRQEKGLALEISAWSWSVADQTGIFGVSAESQPEQKEALIEAIREELRSFSSSSFEDELAKAKRQMVASQFRSLTTISGRASDLASNWHEARDLDFTRRYLAQLEAVNAAEIRRALATLTECNETLTILDPVDSPTAASAQRKLPKPREPETFTLANGTTIALLPDPRVPVVALQAAVRAGQPSETQETAGINRLLAATLPQATRHRSATELANTLESLGASIGASAGNNSLLLQLSGLTPDLATLIPLFGEVLADPALDTDAIESERASQIASLRETMEDPLSVAFRHLRQRLFGDRGFGIPSLGHEESLATLSRLSLAAHHSLHVRGPNLTVALAGDFDPAEARDLLASALDPLPEGEVWRPAPSTLLDPSEDVIRLAKKQAILAIGYPGSAALDADRHSLRMLNEWASDMAGPLFTRIREDLGLAYQVGATQFLGHDTGMFAFYLATDPDQIELAETELTSEIQKIAEHGIPDEAFERVRSTVLSAVALDQQAPGSIARHAAVDLLFGLPVTHHRELRAIYQNIASVQVRETAKSLLDSRKPVIIRVLPGESPRLDPA